MLIDPRISDERAAVAVPLHGTSRLPVSLDALFRQFSHPFRQGRTLLLEGDSCDAIYFVRDGWLSLSKSLEDGQNQIIDFVLPGDMADPTAADGAAAYMSVDALTDGTLAAIPVAQWDRLVATSPDVFQALRSLDAARRARRAERILRLAKGTAEMRVAYALMEFCVRVKPDDAGAPCQFHVPLTQQLLGEYVGLSSVHVCRTMRRMVRNGILEMKDHMSIRVFDPDALAALAHIDVQSLKRAILPDKRRLGHA